jgi:hypothetical protein
MNAPITVELNPAEYNALAEIIRRAPVSRGEALFVGDVLVRMGDQIEAQLAAQQEETPSGEPLGEAGELLNREG